MPREFQFQVSPEVAANESLLAQHVAKLFQVSPKEIQKVDVLKRSIDARQKAIKMNIKANVFLVGEEYKAQKIELPDYPNVANKQEVIVVGAGLGGLSTALRLVKKGFKVTWILSTLFAILGVVIGLVLSFYVSIPSGATIVIVLIFIFILTLIFSKRTR